MDMKENMCWPPQNLAYHKMREHSAWFSGDAENIANFYSLEVNKSFIEQPFDTSKQTFWGRQIKNQGETYIHVPVANDIAETSANLIFSESPIITIGDLKKNKEDQKLLEKMLTDNGFFSKLLEAAESCAAIGGVYLVAAWDSEVSEFPIPVIWQADYAIPEFKYGLLHKVTFWSIQCEEKEKVWRLLEQYEKGMISYKLYLGREDKLGHEVPLDSLNETMGLVNRTFADIFPVVYVPNVLPNKLNRMSCQGRSDFLGIEGLMDAFDEIYTMWSREIMLAQAKILLPESFLRSLGNGKSAFNPDKTMYVGLDIDPISGESAKITPQQFEIRSEDFERTALNYLERIIASAGYSPQSFGLSVQGRSESGLALQLRERKSFATKAKKEKYWEAAIRHLVKCIMVLYKSELSGSGIDENLEINISFSDGVMNNLSEISDALTKITTAKAASIETKIRMLHPDWNEEKIATEIKLIQDEVEPIEPPDGNLDQAQLEDDEETEE